MSADQAVGAAAPAQMIARREAPLLPHRTSGLRDFGDNRAWSKSPMYLFPYTAHLCWHKRISTVTTGDLTIRRTSLRINFVFVLA